MKAIARHLSSANASRTALNKQEGAIGEPTHSVIRESYRSVADPVVIDDVEPHSTEVSTGFTREASYASVPDPVVIDDVEPHVPKAPSTRIPTELSDGDEEADKTTVDDGATLVPTDSAESDRPTKAKGRGKFSPLKKWKSFVQKGGNKGSKTATSVVDAATPIVVLEHDALQVPASPARSITPSQLGELVDISMASEASLDVPPNAPPSPAMLPSIEAVLASSPRSRSPTLSLALESPHPLPAFTFDNPDPVFPEPLGPPAKALVDEFTPTPDLPPSLEALAAEIRSLVSKIPRPPIDSSPPNCPGPSSPKQDGEGKPIPPSAEAGRGFALPTNLARYLKDRGLMSGEAQVSHSHTRTDAEATSVWSFLDALRAPWANDDEDDDDVGRKLMLYVPLDFGDGSKVEVAQAVEVEVGVYDTTGGKGTTRYFGGEYLPQGFWPFEGWWGSKKKPVEVELPKVETPAADKKPSKKVYLPSPDKLSVEIAWWGYRLHLPPPIVEKFSESAEQASKQGALITTALQFLITHIPVALVPLPLKPLVSLLVTLVPFIGYIGSFLVWSAAQLKSFDQGLGISLTATWLLPVALIPGAIKPASPPAETPAKEGEPENDQAPPATNAPSSTPVPEDPPSTPSPEEPPVTPAPETPASEAPAPDAPSPDAPAPNTPAPNAPPTSTTA